MARTRFHLLVPALLGACLGACQALPAGGAARLPPAPADDGARVPVAGSAFIGASVNEARRLIREHRKGQALRVLDERRALSEAEPERCWLLVAILTERHEGARARRAAAGLPDTSFGAAIRALAAETPAAGLSHVGPWLGGRHPWAHLAAAIAHGQLGDHEAVVRSATRALAGAPPFVRFDAYFVRARGRMEQGRLAEAEADAAAARQANPLDARGPVLEAEMARRRGELAQAVRILLQAMALAPQSETYPRRVAELLRESNTDMPWAEVAAAAAPTDPEPAERTALRALLLKHAGRHAEAVATYRQALSDEAVPVPLERELREVLAWQGRFGEVVSLLLRAAPTSVRRDPRNQLRLAWDRLEALGRLLTADAANPERRLELARTMVQLGALPEALATLSGAPQAEARLLRARVAGHVAFERALHLEIEAGYRAGHAKAAPPSFDRMLARARVLGLRHAHSLDHAAFTSAREAVNAVPVIGQWLDHHTRSASPLVSHFRRYGKFLMMGQRRGQPTEAIVFSLASLVVREPIRTPGGVVRHDVAVGYDRTLRGYIDAQGGALGGACLADGLWLDLDSTRHVDNDIRRAMRLDAGLPERAAQIEPLAPSGRDGVFALTDGGGVAVRLLHRYVRRTHADQWGSFGTLRAHEGSHALDIERHLPILQGLPRSIALFVRNGLSPARVEMELERRAQLGAALLAPDPDLAVAEMLMAIPVTQREPEVHDGGYRDALARMVRYIYKRSDLYPQIDRRRRIVCQLDRLSNAQIREVAAAALRVR